MQFTTVVVGLTALVIGALATPIDSGNSILRKREISYGNPSKAWNRGTSIRLDYKEKANHDAACKDSEHCNLKLKRPDSEFKWIDEDLGNPDDVVYEDEHETKRLRFNYGSNKGNFCGDHYICYINVEVETQP